MRDRKLDRLFERFRREGDADALGEVFDATARELLRVAMSLVHDPVEADDLLQATYLTAIEKAGAYDERRRLVPWLLGILVNHAHEMRRRRGRDRDGGRTVEPEVEGPEREVDRLEVAEALTRAIRGLPPRYREVVEPFVARGEKAAEIARELGRPPGTVRMQIHRGLDLLRRSLPAGLALGALVTTAGPGLPAVRAEVVRAAARHAPVLAAGTATTTTILGGWSMAQKTALATLSVALVSGLAWIAATGAEPGAGTAASPATAGSERLAGEDALAPAGPRGAPAAGGEARGPAADAERAAVAEPAAGLYERSLSGVTGRVVEADGTPVPGTLVELLELGFDRLDTSATDVFEGAAEPGWSVSSARTGDDGRFRLRGARAHALHALSIDPGGARPCLQLVDDFLAPGETTDVGDVVLAPTVPARGRIVDAGGRPIAGVRLRAGLLNEDFEWERFAKADTDTPVYVQQNDFLGAMIELPEAARALGPRIPFVQATSRADGTFELAGAPAGTLHVLVDHPDHLGRAVTAPAPTDGARELGDVVLETGRTLQGRVVDGDGEPVEGAEVRAGALFSLGWFGPDLALLATDARTDADGRFALSGVQEEGQPVFAARYGPTHPWVVRKPKDGAFVVIDLPATCSVPVEVVGADGEPIDSAELAVFKPSLVGAAIAWGTLIDGRRTFGRVERRGPGHYEVVGLQEGSYVLRGRAQGFGVAEARLRAREGARPVTLELRPERPLAVRVVDAASGEPLARSSVSVIADRERTHALGRAVTGDDGAAHVPGLPAEIGPDAYLRVEHPRYAAHNVALVLEGSEQTREVAVRLAPGGGILARCRAAGAAPVGPVMIELDLPPGAEFANDYTKRFGVADADGDVRFSSLPPGTWRYRVFERYLNGDIWPLVTDQVSAFVLASGQVEVRSGEVAEVDVDLSDHEFELPLPAGTCAIRGVALRDGTPFRGAIVKIDAEDLTGYETQELVPGEDGTYALEDLPAGRFRVALWEEHETDQGWTWTRELVERDVTLAPGEAAVVHFRLRTTPIEVRVARADGEPATGGYVSVQALEPGDTAAGGGGVKEGAARIELLHGGRVRVAARCGEEGMASLETTLEPGEGNDPVQLVLVRGVPVSGRVRVPDEVDMHESSVGSLRIEHSPALRLLRVDDGTEWNSVPLTFVSGEASFRLGGITPGTWSAQVVNSPHDFLPLTLEIGADGAPDLELVFEER